MSALDRPDHRSHAYHRFVATLVDGLGEHRVCRREAVDLAGGASLWVGAGGDTVSMAGSETGSPWGCRVAVCGPVMVRNRCRERVLADACKNAIGSAPSAAWRGLRWGPYCLQW